MHNIALLGAGRIGHIHAANIATHPASTLYAIVDPWNSAVGALAHQYNAKVLTLEQALSDPQVDAVVIASATDQHADQIELAAKQGKAIFCEKPIHLDSARVAACLATVDAYNAPLFVAFNRRFDPNFRQLKAQYQAGHIGKAESLLIVSRDPAAPPVEYIKVSGGLFRDMTIHDFDMVRFIMDEEPISVFATASNLVDPAIGKAGDIDTATVILGFASGAQATIINSRRSGYGYDQRIELHGEKGLLRANNILENRVVCLSHSGTLQANPQDFFLERYADAYRGEWHHFITALQEKAPFSCSGIDGLKALNIADKARESLISGHVVSL